MYIMKSLTSVLLFLLLTTPLATPTDASDDGTLSRPIHLIRPKTGSHGGHHVLGISCMSWRLGVETHNIIGWSTIPKACGSYVGHYMLGYQYRQDSKAVTYEALLYAKSLNVSKDGKDLWIFDIDETSLSNLPYFAHHGFGVEVYNATAFNAWELEGRAPPLPESLELYKKLRSLGIKVAFLTGRGESQRSVTQMNLKSAGYHTWEKLILKDSSYTGKTAVVYKSTERKKLEEGGYRIVGNIGDQWSDILGTNERTFKLPDPMYYIS